jgi:hypothetical protein
VHGLLSGEQLRDLACKRRSRDPCEQGTSIPNVLCTLPALDRGEDRLQQRAGIVGRARVPPQSGEVGRRAQFDLEPSGSKSIEQGLCLFQVEAHII